MKIGSLHKWLRLTLMTGLVSLVTAHAVAERYPVKPVRVVTSEPGGVNDVVTRMVAQGLSARWSQHVIVDNRGGAGGAIAADIVARAAPNGYTLLSYGSALWLAPFLREHVSYDTLRDFAPVIALLSSPVVIVVHPSVSARSVRELIALAKARPGALNYASGGAGSTPHLAAELFKRMAGVELVRISYKSVGPALIDLSAGHVQLMFATAGSVMSHVKAGRLRALAVASARTSTLTPGLPTVAETLPGYEFSSIWGWLAPKRTPAALIRSINRDVAAVLKDPAINERLASLGVEAAGGPPEEFGAGIRSDIDRLGKLIRELGIRAD